MSPAVLAPDVRAARADLATFAELVGWPLQPWQADALRLPTRTTVLVSARQLGKSYSLAVLGLWWAFRQPGQRVLVISAGDEAAKRLLATVRTIAAHPLLAGSVHDEGLSLLRLSNGSEVRSVPASERQIRGWSVDLLLLDEAALIDDNLVFGAAMPTTAARPEARIVLASSPWSTEGAFYRLHLAGMDTTNTSTRTYRWRVEDAPWITESVIEHARQTLPELRFKAEYLGEFVGAADAFLSRSELLDNTADYRLLAPGDARGEPVVVGLDWGRQYDAHALAVVGSLDDHARNQNRPPLFLAWCTTSRQDYAAQVAEVAALARHDAPVRKGVWGGGRRPLDPAHRIGGGMVFHPHAATVGMAHAAARRPGYDVREVRSECNGVGAAPTEALAARMRTRVVPVHTSQQSKEDAYGRLRMLLTEHRLVLPDDPELLRQLACLAAEPTPSGGLRIQAANPAVHDDLPDALVLALSAVPLDAHPGRATEAEPETYFLTTPAGVVVPAEARPRRGALAPTGAVLRTYS